MVKTDNVSLYNLHIWWFFFLFRYNNDLELEDAIHTAILTLKVDRLFLNWQRLKHLSWFFTAFLFPTLVCLFVSGELWGSDDGGKHRGGNLQRGRVQKTHPSRGERLPGSHRVNTPSLTGWPATSQNRFSGTVANRHKEQEYAHNTIAIMKTYTPY